MSRLLKYAATIGAIAWFSPTLDDGAGRAGSVIAADALVKASDLALGNTLRQLALTEAGALTEAKMAAALAGLRQRSGQQPTMRP